MRDVPAPRVHLFVCTNHREGSPLGPGCGARGQALYDELKRRVSQRRLVTEAWITRTHCLGICPRSGATVAVCAGRESIHAEVEPDDAEVLLDRALEGAANADAPWETIEAEIASAEALQRQKVIALARRLKPELTPEDIQNPHDFPELDDPDWHYADGILTGIQSVATALRAMRKRDRT